MHLSVVVPVYRCEACLGPLCDRVAAVLNPLGMEWEIVLVDDRSPDDAWATIAQFARADPHVRGVRLTRNFGQHAAITAGLAEARGERVIVMDCDLQDPPEEIPRLLARADEGYDIVLARRIARQHSRFRTAAAATYFWLMRVFVNRELDGEYGSFSLITRKVVDEYLRLKDHGRHYLFILHWLGFERSSIDVVHAARFAGESSYSFKRLVRHALDGIFFQTTVLLRWIVYLGFAVSLAGLLLAVYLAVVALVSHPYPGWTSLAVLVLLIGGIAITTTGVSGLYIGQIFDQTKDRPLFVVDERVGGGAA